MDEGLRGNFTPVRFLSLADDLKALAYRAVWVCPGRDYTCVGFVGVLDLAISRQRLEVLILLSL